MFDRSGRGLGSALMLAVVVSRCAGEESTGKPENDVILRGGSGVWQSPFFQRVTRLLRSFYSLVMTL